MSIRYNTYTVTRKGTVDLLDNRVGNERVGIMESTYFHKFTLMFSSIPSKGYIYM